MKFIVSVFLTALLAFAFGLYMPWWAIAVAACVVSVLLVQSRAASFWSGFLGIFLLWLLICIRINAANDGILAHRMARILPLEGSVFLLIFATAIVGGLVGGMAALTGSLLRKKDGHGRTS